MGSIVFRSSSPMPFPCSNPTCPVCYPIQKLGNWAYSTCTDPTGGAVYDFSTYDPIVDVSDDMEPEDCDCYEQPLSNTERVTDLDEEVQNLRAAVLDLTTVVEYLLIWTGKKGNKMDREKYLNGFIDAIREHV